MKYICNLFRVREGYMNLMIIVHFFLLLPIVIALIAVLMVFSCQVYKKGMSMAAFIKDFNDHENLIRMIEAVEKRSEFFNDQFIMPAFALILLCCELFNFSPTEKPA